MKISKLDKKNNIKLPAEIRKKIGLRNGDYIFFDCDEEGRVYLCSLRNSDPYQVVKESNVIKLFREYRNKDIGENFTDR